MKLPARMKALFGKDQIKTGLASLWLKAKRIPKNVLYIIVTALLLLGWLSSLSDLLSRSDKERSYAEKSGQRVVFLGDKSRAGQTITKEAQPDDFEVEEISPEEKKLRELEKKNPETDTETDAKKPAEQDITAPAEPDQTISEKPVETSADLSPKQVDAKDAKKAASEKPAEKRSVSLSDPPILQQENDETVPVIRRGPKSLVFAPAPEISKKTKSGYLPKISSVGLRASELYAANYKPEDGKTPLGIVVTGAGFSARSLNLLLQMPQAVSVSVSPYAPDITSRIETIRNAGHEVWVNLPTQTKQYPAEDPGPYGIISSISKKENTARLMKILSTSLGAVGVIFAPEQTLSQFNSIFDTMLDEIEKLGLYGHFLQKTVPATRSKAAKNLRHSDVVVPASMPVGKLKLMLNQVAQQLSSEETAEPVIIAFSASVHHLRVLKEWLKQDIQNLPVKLAPLSSFYVDYEAIAAAEKAAAEKAEKEKKKGGGH